MTDTLSFNEAKRGGVGNTARSYLDFVVNRHALSVALEVRDQVGVFGWLEPRVESEYALQLLMKTPSALASGCVPLYICGECADLGCGAITVRVTRDQDCIVWSDFAYENNLGSDERATLPYLRGVRDFWFDEKEYAHALARFVLRARRR